jgi:hypothetical protein
MSTPPLGLAGKQAPATNSGRRRHHLVCLGVLVRKNPVAHPSSPGNAVDRRQNHRQ